MSQLVERRADKQSHTILNALCCCIIFNCHIEEILYHIAQKWNVYIHVHFTENFLDLLISITFSKILQKKKDHFIKTKFLHKYWRGYVLDSFRLKTWDLHIMFL